MGDKVYSRLAQLLDAYRRNVETGNDEWRDKHQEMIDSLCENHLPHGSGFDSGVSLDYDRSNPNKLVFNAPYHHMDENGFYAGWGDYAVTVKPSLAFGFDLTISGRDRNGFKDYATELFDYMLREEVDY